MEGTFTIYRCPECGWWEGDANLARGAKCNGGWDEAAGRDMLHRPVAMVAVETVASTATEGADDA